MIIYLAGSARFGKNGADVTTIAVGIANVTGRNHVAMWLSWL